MPLGTNTDPQSLNGCLGTSPPDCFAGASFPAAALLAQVLPDLSDSQGPDIARKRLATVLSKALWR